MGAVDFAAHFLFGISLTHKNFNHWGRGIMARSTFDTFLSILLILLSALIVYWFMQLLFGGSPGLSEFSVGLIVLLSGFFIKMYREVGEIKVTMRHSFSKMKEDMESVKKKLKI